MPTGNIVYIPFLINSVIGFNLLRISWGLVDVLRSFTTIIHSHLVLICRRMSQITPAHRSQLHLLVSEIMLPLTSGECRFNSFCRSSDRILINQHRIMNINGYWHLDMYILSAMKKAMSRRVRRALT